MDMECSPEKTDSAPNQSSPPANQSNPIQQQRCALIQKYKDLDPQVKEWEKSLPHDEYFFPGVPLFKLTELRERLGLETDARSRKIPKTGGRADVGPASSSSAPLIEEGEDDPKFEHEAVCWRDNALPSTPAGQPSSVKEGVTFNLKDCLVSFDDDEGSDLVRIDGTTHVEVDSLLRKHVLLCCFYVPLYWAIDPVPYVRSISSLCAELATLEKENQCEIVIVAKMTPHWADNEAAFNHFSKAFPRSCLTVPFHHKKRIDRICQSLNLQSFYPCSLLVSPDGKVLRTGLEHVWSYGVEGYPFSNEHLRAVEEDDKRLMSGSCSSPLATLLGLNRRLRDALTGKEISVSELEDKDVGLYLCCTGNLLHSLSKVYLHCKNKGYTFEIVVVCFPDVTGLGMSEFEPLMTDAFTLQGLSWWILPGDNSVVARRLIRISGDKLDDRMSDRLLTVGAHGKYVDPIADVIMQVWRIDDAYPFSLAAFLDREVERLGKVELDSILGMIKSAVHVKEKNQIRISSEDLQANLKGKRVFVYHTALEELTGCSFLDDSEADIWSRCKEVKDMCPDCEVLYVQSYEMEDYKWNFPDGLSLYMCPYDESLSDYLYEITSVANLLPVRSLAFGTDGHIASLARRGRHDPLAQSLREDIRCKFVSSMKEHDMNKCKARLSHLLRSYAYLGTRGV